MSMVTKREGQVVIKPEENIVVPATKYFRDELMSLINEGAQEIVVDLDGIEMVDSVGLGIFIAIDKEIKFNNGKLKIINASKDIIAFFRIMHLDKQIEVKMKRNTNQLQE